MEGWIKLHKKLLEWEWYDDINVKCLFLHILLTANYEQKKWHGITIERGQLVTSVNNLASQLQLSAMQIRTALDKLKSTNEITIKTTNKFTLITIYNYAKYQCFESVEQQTKQQTNNNQITNEQQTNNNNIRNKEYKNIRNKEYNSMCVEKSTPQTKPTKSIEERENDFMQLVADNGKNIYPDEMLQAFFDYWTEKSQNGKKMHFEMQKTFDVKKRLATWARNENKFKSNYNGINNGASTGSIQERAARIAEYAFAANGM